jgi:SAP domain-containing ribonucleoprotein
MATNYASLKVPELKKLLSERGLAQTGNKTDLVARLKEDDESKAPAKPAGGASPRLPPNAPIVSPATSPLSLCY